MGVFEHWFDIISDTLLFNQIIITNGNYENYCLSHNDNDHQQWVLSWITMRYFQKFNCMWDPLNLVILISKIKNKKSDVRYEIKIFIKCYY